MTKREFLNAIAAGTMNEEIMAQASKMIEAMDAGNEKRIAKAAEKASEAYAPFIEIFVGALGAEAKTASDLLSLFEGMTTPAGKKPSVQFVTAVGGKAVKQGLASKIEVKVEGKTKKGYVIAEAETEMAAE